MNTWTDAKCQTCGVTFLTRYQNQNTCLGCANKCCEKATPRKCGCDRSFTCPEHGESHSDNHE